MCVSEKIARIRVLNDRLRRGGRGGRIVITAGLEALGADQIREVLVAIARFDHFTEDNDPWGEHDCAILTVNGYRVLFKVDYYDVTLTALSPDPSDPALTQRVMTVMLADEY